MQLRSLQTLAEVATEHNSTLIFPIPIELLEFMRRPGAVDGVSPFAVPPPTPASPPAAAGPSFPAAVAPIPGAAAELGTPAPAEDRTGSPSA